MVWLVIYCDGNNLFVEDLRVTKDHATFRDAEEAERKPPHKYAGLQVRMRR